MPQLEFVAVCERVLIDDQTNRVTLVDLVDVLPVPDAPITVPMRFSVYGVWRRSVEERLASEDFEWRLEFRWFDEDIERREVVFQSGYAIPAQKLRLRVRHGIIGLKVPAFGELRLVSSVRTKGKDFEDVQPSLALHVERIHF